MKRLFYILLSLLWSCSAEPLYENNDTGQVQVPFTVDVPLESPNPTKAINENSITDLQLLVFDQNGRFLSRHTAVASGVGYIATLKQSSDKRIIHFVANYDFSGFNDEAMVTKDEGEVIAPLQSVSLVFWQRVVLASGINSTALSSQVVALVRNMAKFTLENSPTSGLTNAKFALFNTASVGSVAPFNTSSAAFESVITEPAGAVFTTAGAISAADVYTFERKNSSVTVDPTFVIVQGTYAGATYYYKIDIIDPSKNLYDIQRNVWFKIVIQSVAMAGYTTIEAAKSSPASNNISASVLLQSYPTISDGSYVLSVDKTAVSFTTNGQSLNANAVYKTVGGVVQNSLVTVTLVQDAAFPVVNGAVAYDVATGNITATINNVPANGVAYTATIKIEAGNLSRTIRLMLHAPFTFTNLSVTPSVVAVAGDSPAVFKFTVPSEAQYLLPFDCYITSAYLTPAFGNIEVTHENGLYKYKWKVTAVGVQTINLKTNIANAAETILLDAALFQRGQVAYTNTAGLYRFSNVVITPNPVDFGVGKSVTIKFTVPTAGTYKIYTANLTPVNGAVVAGIYTYIAATAGEQVVNFTTSKQNIAETIKLTGTNYYDYTITLSNQLVQISGKLTFGTSGAVINQGVVTALVGTKVVGVFATTSTGTYQIALEVSIGDALIFRYTSQNTTYTTTTTITGSPMVITKKLI